MQVILFIYIKGLPWMKYTSVFPLEDARKESEIFILLSSKKSYRCRIDIESISIWYRFRHWLAIDWTIISRIA